MIAELGLAALWLAAALAATQMVAGFLAGRDNGAQTNGTPAVVSGDSGVRSQR